MARDIVGRERRIRRLGSARDGKAPLAKAFVGACVVAVNYALAPHVTLKPLAPEQLFTTLAAMGQVDTFTQILGTFLRHFKSAGITIARCEARATLSTDVPRSRAFLKKTRYINCLLSLWGGRLLIA